MSYSINATNARLIARADLTIFNETQALMKQVITDAGNGLYETTVTDGTTMTESTPTITVTGIQANPTIVGTPSVILGGQTINLGTTGTSLNAVIADINDAAVPGVVASKNATNNLVITFTCSQTTTWTFVIGAGTANLNLGLTASTYTATNLVLTFLIVGKVTQQVDQNRSDEPIMLFLTVGISQIQRIENNH